MKTIIILILLILPINFLSAQGIDPNGWNFSEIFILPLNLGESTVRFEMEAVSTVWTIDEYNSTGNFYITGDYNNPYYPPLSEDPIGELPSDFDPWSDVGGFNFMPGNNQLNPYEMDSFSYGLYKLTVSPGTASIYLDYRDSDFLIYNGSVPIGIQPIDLWIAYDGSSDRFYYINSLGTNQIDLNDFTSTNNGEYLTIWDIKQRFPIYHSPITSYFQQYWDNCLALINYGQQNPRIVWGPYPGTLEGPIEEYHIYYSQHPPGIPPQSFSLLATVNSDVFLYVDDDVFIGNGFNARSYYVKAYYTDNQSMQIETTPTNIVTVNIRPPAKTKHEKNDFISRTNKFNILQNYPNPFNPSTKIKYTLREDSYVILKIYDMLGTEVRELVSEQQTAGDYEIKFNAKDLSSGVYIYCIIASKNGSIVYTDAKQMILIK